MTTVSELPSVCVWLQNLIPRYCVRIATLVLSRVHAYEFLESGAAAACQAPTLIRIQKIAEPFGGHCGRARCPALCDTLVLGCQRANRKFSTFASWCLHDMN